MSNVNLEHLTDELFINNEELEYIDFYYNNIKKIDSNFFENLKNLKEIDLRKNLCIDQHFTIVEGNLEFNERDFCDCRAECEREAKTEVILKDSGYKDSLIVLFFIYLGYSLMLLGVLLTFYTTIKSICHKT